MRFKNMNLDFVTYVTTSTQSWISIHGFREIGDKFASRSDALKVAVVFKPRFPWISIHGNHVQMHACRVSDY